MNARSLSVARLGLFAAVTLVLGYLESTIALPVSIPGVKIGLANVAVLIALYLMGPRWAAAIMGLKVCVISLFVGAPSMMLYSLAGSVLAYLAMLVCWKTDALGIVAASVAAALMHNAGQLLMAFALMQTPAIFINAPVMAAAACIMGALTGSVALGVIEALGTAKAARGRALACGATAKRRPRARKGA